MTKTELARRILLGGRLPLGYDYCKDCENIELCLNNVYCVKELRKLYFAVGGDNVIFKEVYFV